jgi:hypothetical protein
MFGFNWGNRVATFRWTFNISNSLFMNTSLILNDYNYNTLADFDFSFDLSSGITGRTLKQHYTWYANENNTLNFGFEINNYLFKPGSLKVVTLDNDPQFFDVSSKNGYESALYLANEQQIGTNWSLGYGLRLSYFTRVGQSNEYSYNPRWRHNRNT